jgi:hypothetical protein
LQDAKRGQIVLDVRDGGRRNDVGMAEQQKVGLHAAAEIAQFAVGSARAEFSMPQPGSGARHIAIGKIHHRMAVADEAVRELSLDAMLKRSDRLAAEIGDVNDFGHAVRRSDALRDRHTLGFKRLARTRIGAEGLDGLVRRKWL